MKDCKFNEFNIRFFLEGEEFHKRKKYNFAIFEEGTFDRSLLFANTDKQIVFNANNYLHHLGNCEKFIVVKNGVNFYFLWTSLKGKPELYDMRGGMKELYDYLFLTLMKRKQVCLYFGDSFEAPLAGWRNSVSVDVIHREEKTIDKFLKNTVETFLPF